MYRSILLLWTMAARYHKRFNYLVPSEARSLLRLGSRSMASGRISCVYLKFRSYSSRQLSLRLPRLVQGCLNYIYYLKVSMQGLQVNSSAGLHSPTVDQCSRGKKMIAPSWPKFALPFAASNLFHTIQDLNLAVWYGIAIHTCTQEKFWRILIWRFKGKPPNFPAIRYVMLRLLRMLMIIMAEFAISKWSRRYMHVLPGITN